MMLKPFQNESTDVLEIGVDEAGRGPMLGPVYSAAVILPRDSNINFDFSCLKDSKRFHSKKKLNVVANYIKENAYAYSIASISESEIDSINIRQATHNAMHKALRSIIHKTSQSVSNENKKNYQLLIDGSDFKPFMIMDKAMQLKQVPHMCITKGDNTYCAIAAASILAKTSRDAYIEKLCEDNPELNDKYGILSNKGYGTKTHMDGIKRYGITKWHRKSFGVCKQMALTKK